MSQQAGLRAVKGMNDILPPQSAAWLALEHAVRETMRVFDYANARTPILEHTQLFVRGLGEVTDVVEKEMYTFTDRADKRGHAESLSLRPENTAGMVRAVVEHNLLRDGGKRLYYMGPMFRRERPQRGRYRQFHQIGAEALGFVGPELDAELILMAAHLWQKLGLQGWRLELNCLGEPPERLRHRQTLIDYFEHHQGELDADARRRLHSNPLRILDTKNPAMQELVEAAPKLSDYISAASRQHFEAVQAILDAAGIAWRFNPRLVRGLDYYNLTVFEFVTDELGAQGTFCGGGRYDYLFEEIGGKSAPAVGWAIGVERVLELMGKSAQAGAVPDVYAIIPDEQGLPQVMPCLQALRATGLHVAMYSVDGPQRSSLRRQLRKANASGARYALIFGADELAAGEVSLKDMRDADGAQKRLALASVATWAKPLQS